MGTAFNSIQTQATQIPDPYYGGAQGFELVLDLLEEASEGLLQLAKQMMLSHG